MPLGSSRRRRRARRDLQRAVDQLADRAQAPGATVWRVQPVIEVCAAAYYPQWRRARTRAWKRDGDHWHTDTWPDRLFEPQSAAVLLPQSHGGRWRGAPAEIALPLFTSGTPKLGRDIQHPYEVHALALLLRWATFTAAQAGSDGALLAPPLIDLIAPRPRPRVPCDLGLTWPLAPSKPHIRPARQA